MPFFTSFSGKILSASGLKLGPQIFQFIKTFTSSVQEYNLRTDLLANGWDGITPVAATLTVNAGVYIWSDSTSTAAFTTGSLVSNSIISIINLGYIMGRGGDGVLAAAGTNAGNAIDLSHDVSINNVGYIAGGGGGGGGNSGWQGNYLASGGGGAGGGNVTGGYGGSGGAIGATGTNGTTGGSNYYVGSGGGGRILPGIGGIGVTCTPPTATVPGLGGGAGGGGAAHAGAFGTPSVGGSGGSAGNAGGNGTGSDFIGAGMGGGGGWGASGGSGGNQDLSTSYAGGAGGKAVNLNGNTVTWLATGTRYGAIS